MVFSTQLKHHLISNSLFQNLQLVLEMMILNKSDISYFFIETEKGEKGYISKSYLPHIKF